MKKLIGLLLMVSFLVVGFPTVFAAENLDVSFDINESSTEKTVILNSSVATSDYDLYIVAYKGEKMVAVQKIDMEINTGKNVINTGINWDNIDRDKVRIFVWEEGLKIHSEKYEYDVLPQGTTKWEGIVAETPYTNIAYAGVYDSSATPTFSLADAYYWEGDVKVSGIAEDIVCDKVDVNPFLGKNVIAYIGEDSATGKQTVYEIYEKTGLNNTLKINGSQLAYDYSEAVIPNVVCYTEPGSNKVQEIGLQHGTRMPDGQGYWYVVNAAKVYLNYKSVADIASTIEIYNAVKLGGTVEFISNDADDDYEVVMITAYNGEAVVGKIEESGVYISKYYSDSKYDSIDTEDDEKLYIVCKDGEKATVADIAVNDTISFVEIVKDDFIILYVSSATVEGMVESYDSVNLAVVTINGTDYSISPAAKFDAYMISKLTGTFFLNVDGQIAHVEEPVDRNYALVLASYEESSGVSTSDYLKVVQTDGTLADYPVSRNAMVYNADREVITYDVKAYFDSMLTGTELGFLAKNATVEDVQANPNLMVKLTISNDKITEVRLLDDNTAAAVKSDKYNAATMSVGNIDFDESTVVFSVKQTSGNIDAEDIVVCNPKDIFTDGEEINGALKAYDMDDMTKKYYAAVGFGLVRNINPSSDLFIVTGKKTVSIDDIDAYIFTGIMNGEETGITVYDEDEAYPSGHYPWEVEVGDVLLLASVSEDGYVSEIFNLVSYDWMEVDRYFWAYTAIIKPSNAEAYDNICSGYGIVDSYDITGFSINTDVKNDNDGTIAVKADENILFDSVANYTIVDFVDNPKNPEISVARGSQQLFGANNTKAYVRYVDGELTDVIVYRLDVNS